MSSDLEQIQVLTVTHMCAPVCGQIRDEAPRSATEEEELEEEESHVSEGQLIPSSQSYSDDSDISEEIPEG